jgi:zinc transporter
MSLKTQTYELDGKGAAREIELTNMQSDKMYWIRLNIDSVKSFFTTYFPNTPSFVKAMLSAKESRPRTLAYEDSLLAAFRGVNLNKGSDPEDMISIRLWIHGNTIITVQRRKLATTQDMIQTLKNGVGPKNISEFLEVLLSTMTDKTIDAISSLDNSLDHIEDELIARTTKIDRTQLNVMRRRIVIMRRYLVPQRDAIGRIPVDKLTWLNETNSMHLREIADSCTRAVEELNAEHERATIIHEELFTIAQETLDKRMYLLSLVAIIFMPLSFITGLLGINVGGIPGSSFKYAFLVVCIAMFLIFCGQFLYLKRKKWL